MVPLFINFSNQNFLYIHQLQYLSIFIYNYAIYLNAKISCNFITLSFQHIELQYFCSKIPQQRAGYSTSYINSQEEAGIYKYTTLLHFLYICAHFLWFEHLLFFVSLHPLVGYQELRAKGQMVTPKKSAFYVALVYTCFLVNHACDHGTCFIRRAFS